MPKSERKLSGTGHTLHERQSYSESLEDDADADTNDGYDTPEEEDYQLKDIRPAPTRHQRTNESGRSTLANRIYSWPLKIRHSDKVLRWVFKFARQMCHTVAPYAFNKRNLPYTEYEWVKLHTEVHLQAPCGSSNPTQNYHSTNDNDHKTHTIIKSERETLKQEKSPDVQEVSEEVWRPGATWTILDCHEDLNRRIASCVQSQVRAQVKTQLHTQLQAEMHTQLQSLAPLLQLSQLATQMSESQTTPPTATPDPYDLYDRIAHGPRPIPKTQDPEEIDISQIPEYRPATPLPSELNTSPSYSLEPWQLVSRQKKRGYVALDPENPSSVASIAPPTDAHKRHKHQKSAETQDQVQDPPRDKGKERESKESKKLKEKDPKKIVETVENHSSPSISTDSSRGSWDSQSPIPECDKTNATNGKAELQETSNGRQSGDHAAKQHHPLAELSIHASSDGTTSHNTHRGDFHEYSIYVTFRRRGAQSDIDLNNSLGTWLANWFPKPTMKRYSLWDHSYYYMVSFDTPIERGRGVDLLERPWKLFRCRSKKGPEVLFFPYQEEVPAHNPLLCRAPIKSTS